MFSIFKPLFLALAGADCQSVGGLVLLNKKFRNTKHGPVVNPKYKIFLKAGTQKPLTPGLSSSNQGGTLPLSTRCKGFLSYLILYPNSFALKNSCQYFSISFNFETSSVVSKTSKVKFSTPLSIIAGYNLLSSMEQHHFLFGYAVSIFSYINTLSYIDFTTLNLRDFIDPRNPSSPQHSTPNHSPCS